MPEYCNSYVDTKKQWQKECQYFNQYFNELYQDISEINNTIEKIITLNKQKTDLLKNHPNKDLLAILDEYTEQIKNLESTSNYIDSKIEEFNYETDSLSLGLLKPIHSFFKTKKYSDFIQNNLRLIRLKNEQLELKEKNKLDIQNLQNKSKELKLDIIELEQIEKYLSICIKFLKDKSFEIVDFNENDFWQNYSTDCDKFHKITPYFNEEVEKLRSKLFIQAIKLHEIFINANAHNFLDSLILFSEILNGKFSNIEPDMWKAVWQNFFMIVPVVSTTFHSFDNMFKHFCHNDLAWLIIDEAGQTPPQYAASAIYKSKNVIVVGDPMQTAPISVLGQALIDKICQKLNVDYSLWSPSEVSVQHLADRTSLYQTQYGNISVGFPLLVHRRCQSPMFDICNKITYDNKMIFAAAKSDSYLTTILKKSRWIDVQDDHTKKSQYESEEEFKELFKLLKPVFEQDNFIHLLDQIYIITMYKNYSSYIKHKLKQEAYKLRIENKINNFCTNNIGTIHAFQGKEADTVIMVLGAQHSEDWGARNVMTEKPNVLNVGISRAKNNLYVIGNAEIWQKHKYMQDIYNMLGN